MCRCTNRNTLYTFIFFVLTGGECREGVQTSLGFVCFCHPGFAGLFCSIAIDPCLGITCFHGGVCSFKAGDKKPICACVNGFSGEFCELSLDPCGGVICKNSGTCKPSPMGNGFLCACVTGYYGEVCEKEMNPCESSPCKHGGKCKNYISRFLCICTGKFSGIYCENRRIIKTTVSPTQNDDTLKTDIDNTDNNNDKSVVNRATSLFRTWSTICIIIAVNILQCDCIT